MNAVVYFEDIAYNKMRAWQGSIGVSDLRGIISPAYVVQRMRGTHNPRYFHYLFRTPGFAKEAESWSYGITSDMWSLRPEHFKAIYSTLPPAEEQAAIVRYLNHATHRLDRAIRAKRKTIALLNEQKQAIIHRAVTRGINPDVPLKDSGINWLGDIPQHWDVGPGLLGLAEKQDRNLGMVETRVLSLSYGRIIIKPEEKLRGLVPESFETYQIVNPGDIIIRPTDLQNDHTSLRVGIVRDRGIITSAYISLVTRPRLAPAFAYQLLNAYDFMKVFYGLGSGMRQNLSFSDFKRLPLVFPPMDEQIAIAAHIEKEIRTSLPVISRIEREIELLREYRTRLIADVVTGKLDVREAAAKLPEEPAPDTAEDVANVRDETESIDEEATA